MEISKREYFAVKILQGLLAGCDENYNYGNDNGLAVKEAVMLADALIDELEKSHINDNEIQNFNPLE